MCLSLFSDHGARWLVAERSGKKRIALGAARGQYAFFPNREVLENCVLLSLFPPSYSCNCNACSLIIIINFIYRGKNTLQLKTDKPATLFLFRISKNLLVYFCKWCNLIGYATRYLFANRYQVAASNATRPSFSQKAMLISRFLKSF